jgi:hypothetical protein
MTKVESGAFRRQGASGGENRRSPPLRFGRDDKSESGAFKRQVLVVGKTAGPPLRFASVGMTKVEHGAFKRQALVVGRKSRSLHCATLRSWKHRLDIHIKTSIYRCLNIKKQDSLQGSRDLLVTAAVNRVLRTV